jgi:hypothetical protein
VHITTVCPFCQTSYQVQSALRGQPIRCPNAVCRKVFTIAPETAVKAGASQRSGSVGDMVPILPAEPVTPADGGISSKHVSEMVPLAPVEPAAPTAEAKSSDGDWWQGPPVVRQASDRPTIALPTPPPATPATPAPAEAAWWRDAPPPARNPQAKTASGGRQPPVT